MGICSIAGCGRPAAARTWCRPHWKRWKRHGDPTRLVGRRRIPAADRFWPKVDTSAGPNGCWPWQGARDDYGYGFFRLVPGENMRKTHRVAWLLTNGDPGDMIVCHTCDNPPCVNPSHLFIGTNQDNVDDRVAKNRSSRKCPHSGETSPSAKLTSLQVVEIRRRYAAGGISQLALGTEYGVSQTQVGRIVRNVRWQHT